MKVDVILITYNQECYIRQAVESIIMQRVQNDVHVRVIVADDHSTDSTISIVKECEAFSPFEFVYLLNDVNQGLQRNYQKAFGACAGDYILILEGDDYWCSPYHIEQHIRFLDLHRECSMSVNGIVLLWNEQSLFEHNPRSSEDDVIYINLRQQIAGNKIGNLSSICFRTPLLQCLPVKMFELDFADWLLGIVFAQYGFIALLKDYTTVYRKHKGGAWSGLPDAEQRRIIETKYHSYNELFDYKYDDMFKKATEKPVVIKKKRTVFDYCPLVLIKLGKYVLPKVLVEKLK